MSELTRPKIVHVRWRDCTSCDAWMLPPEVEDMGCPIIETIGFLTAARKEFICVSVAWEPMYGKIAGTFTIPRVQIVSMKTIAVPKTKRRRTR